MNSFITANTAREIAAEAREHRSNVWNLVFDKIKELIMFDSDITPYVPLQVKEDVEKILKERLK